jgi:hypothetical protein
VNENELVDIDDLDAMIGGSHDFHIPGTLHLDRGESELAEILSRNELIPVETAGGG